jgi:hypothetical protein
MFSTPPPTIESGETPTKYQLAWPAIVAANTNWSEMDEHITS